VTTGVVQVTFMAADEQFAHAVVDGLVADGLVACGQVSGPVRSTYRWQGAVEESVEWRAVLKTTASRSPEVVSRIRSRHPDDVPEVLVTAVVGGDPDYLGWVVDECTPATGPDGGGPGG
jgi:periplasmic divalent cation tolerance protein